MISECSKVPRKEYKNWHDWVEKVINCEFCKNLRFHPINKWYMQKSEPVFENETFKILWDYEIRTNHLIPARKSEEMSYSGFS